MLNVVIPVCRQPSRAKASRILTNWCLEVVMVLDKQQMRAKSLEACHFILMVLRGIHAQPIELNLQTYFFGHIRDLVQHESI